MEIIKDSASLSRWVKDKQIGFVPTMGALHDGHRSLIKRSVDENPSTIVSIFVNPAQFNSSDDLKKYPKTLEDDLGICSELGVDALFCPTEEMIYENGVRTVVTQKREQILCDLKRPGHYSGVLTVVNILFNLINPKKAYFGIKDAQQYVYIKDMVEDLKLGLEIIPCETCREKDTDLAISSRNVLLTKKDREIAKSIPELLHEVSLHKISPLEAKKKLTQKGIDVEYLEVHSFPSLKLKSSAFNSGDRVFFAGTLGSVRLIDNFEFL